MIFVTVGSQMPFDRLIRTVDAWAKRSGRTDVFAQVGPTDFEPSHIAWTKNMTPDAFRQRVLEATVVVAHAGMGSIITALELGKPILVLPRRGALKETRNDHQVDTAKQFSAQGRIGVAFDEDELVQKLDDLEAFSMTRPTCSSVASPELIDCLRRFVQGTPGSVPVAAPLRGDPKLARSAVARVREAEVSRH